MIGLSQSNYNIFIWHVVKAIGSKPISLWECRFDPTNSGSFIFHQMYQHIEGSDWTFANKLQCIQLVYVKAVVAEWLRRLARNQFPSGSVGSNPTNYGSFIFHQMYWHIEGSDWTFAIKLQCIHLAGMWLRRLARNQFPSGSVGSNPTNCRNSFFSKYTDI